MKSLCLITFRPTVTWCDFLTDFSHYRVFIVVDDNKFDLTDLRNAYPNITFIKVRKSICRDHGFVDTNFRLKKWISGWDKALFYFSIRRPDDGFVWFIEDDVFFYNENTLRDIDTQYPDEDFISKRMGVNHDGNKDRWHWRRISIQYEPPYYSCMVCAVRVSQAMLASISAYASAHKQLFFIEALFPTLAMKCGLKHGSPSEFDNIFFRKREFKMDTKNLYHPFKDQNAHVALRAQPSKNMGAESHEPGNAQGP